ncbi:MAG: serine protease [Brevundimonas sp.]
MRTRPWAVPALVGVLGALGACGVVPDPPAPVPTSLVVPIATPSATTTSPDGFDRAHRVALRLRAVNCDGLATGSGFAIDEHTLVTARHVVDDARSVQVSTYDGHDIVTGTALVAADADLAIVRTKDALPAWAELADADPAIGDRVRVAGYPLGGPLTVATGHVTGTRSDPLDENSAPVLVADVPVEPGSSGSPVLDDDGKVAGVVYAKGTPDTTTYLVPVSTLRSMLDDEDALVPVPRCS